MLEINFKTRLVERPKAKNKDHPGSTSVGNVIIVLHLKTCLGINDSNNRIHALKKGGGARFSLRKYLGRHQRSNVFKS